MRFSRRSRRTFGPSRTLCLFAAPESSVIVLPTLSSLQN
jgi:hypothetical protein